MNIELRPLAEIKPYEKNPRINDAAVDAVAESIRRFGFRQPIVVDTDGVIVCGHTRWKAAQKLRLERAPVHVAKDLSPAQVRAYRIADSRLNDKRYDFLFKPKIRSSSETLSALLRDFVGLGAPKCPVTVMDLSAVPFDVRPVVSAQIGRLAFEFNYWNPWFPDFPILLICEEAHAYIPRDTLSQFAGSRKSMERIAKEGRKYGVGLGVVSQRPHEVSETVLAQCGTFLCLRLTNPADQEYVRSLVPEAERNLVDILAGLGRGEAVVLGEGIALPTRLRFHKPNPAPSSDDVDFYEKWKAGPEDLDVDKIVDRWRRQER